MLIPTLKIWLVRLLRRIRALRGKKKAPEAALQKAYGELEQRVQLRTEELNESQSKYEELVNTIDGIVWEANIGSPGYAFVSPQAERITGYPPERWISEQKFWQKILHPEDLEKITGDRYLFPEAKCDTQTEYRIITADGRVLWMRDHIRVIKESGRAVKMRGVIVDISERKRAERAITLAQEKALEAARVKSDFLANMSHEIRTPLNSIVGMSSLGLEYKMSPELNECLTTIKTAGDSLLMLINDILDFSKIEAGKIELEISDFRLKALCQNALEVVRPLAQQKEIALHLEVDPKLPDYVRADAGRILQVLMNMLSNAIKFTKNQGRVTILAHETAWQGARGLKLAVADTGVGISPEAKEKLFQPFTQADSTTTRKYGGTGLGLSICKRLLELMGGQVGVESKENEGSVFWCELALVEGQAENCVPPGDETEAIVAPNTEAHILVVDDNPANLKLMMRLLDRLGFQSKFVSTGKEAFTAYKAAKFDLILMDCQMPEMDGYEATQKIRDQESAGGKNRIPIIALTAHALKGDKEKCLAAGMDDYLAKPITLQNLQLALRKWLSQAPAKTIRVTPAKQFPACEIDYEYLESLNELNAPGQPDLACELIEFFFTAAPLKIKNIEQLHGQGNLESARKEAHSLRSTCHNVGARGLAKLCEGIEYGKLDDQAIDPAALFPRLHDELASALNQLEQYRRNRKKAAG